MSNIILNIIFLYVIGFNVIYWLQKVRRIYSGNILIYYT